MKTFSPKQADIQRKWYLIDAEDQILGRLATQIANLLRGKDKVTFSPHMDLGDYVVVINTEKIKLTGRKEYLKKYYTHSGYPGALKEITVEKLRVKNPTEILYLAVKGMLPKNKLRDQMLSKLKLFKGNEHNHTAQSPETIKLAN